MEEMSSSALRHKQLAILDCFAKECDDHGLSYFLYYGTLIGAARHKGFIPWDDDIDIAMPRESFERLHQINWSSHDLELVRPGSSETSPYLATKLADRQTAIVEEIGVPIDHIGVNIDIFPLDHLDPGSFKTKLRLKLLAVAKSALAVKIIRISDRRSMRKNLALRILKIFVPMRANTLTRLANWLGCTNGAGEHLGSMLGPYGQKELISERHFYGTTQLEFEGRSLPAPSGYQHILTKIYGDYLKLPPEAERVTHHAFRAYWR